MSRPCEPGAAATVRPGRRPVTAGARGWVWLTGLLAVGVATSCTEPEPEASTPARSAAPQRLAAPDFELPSLKGETVRLSDFRGTVVVLNFWASWCSPCRTEAPSLQRLYAAREGEEFELLAVSIDVRRESVERFVAQQGLEFPVLLDAGQEAARRYGIDGIPVTLLIDRQGRIAERVDGAHEWDAAPWREAIARLVRE